MEGLNRGAASVLDRAASGAGADRRALYFEDDERTYGQLRDNARRVANGLAERGVRKGDRVAVLLKNSIEWVELFFGIADLGAVIVPVNVYLKAPEIAHMWGDSGARIVVVDADGVDRVEETGIDPDLAIGVGGARTSGTCVAYEDLLLASARRPDGPGADLEDPLNFHYSSGTTGLPKAAVHTHGNIMWNSFHQIVDMNVSRDDVSLVIPSFSWAAGFHALTFPTLWAGGTAAILPTTGMSLERIISSAERYHGTRCIFVPTLLRLLMPDDNAKERLRASPISYMLSGGEPAPVALLEQFMDELPDITMAQGYGLSEFPASATILQPEDALSRAGSCGQPTSITRMAIGHEDGTVTDSGQGELLIRSPATTIGYHGQPERTAEAFAGGWFHTGDLGELDDEGFMRITGRLKDMIITGGLNVYPREAEEILARARAVQDVAVVGVPDEQLGEISVAVVVADETVDGPALLAECKAQMATYKVPREVLVFDGPLPRTPTGKLLKRELRPWASKQLGRE